MSGGRLTPLDPARFAALLCGYCLDVQPGQQVVVRSTTLAAPLLLALQRELLEREAWDMICDLRRGARLSADGEVLQRDGRFLL